MLHYGNAVLEHSVEKKPKELARLRNTAFNLINVPNYRILLASPIMGSMTEEEIDEMADNAPITLYGATEALKLLKRVH